MVVGQFDHPDDIIFKIGQVVQNFTAIDQFQIILCKLYPLLPDSSLQQRCRK